MRIAQERCDAKMKYDKTAHKIEISTSSVRNGTQKGYRRSWKRWLLFRRCQNLAVWLDGKDECRGENLMNFILGEHDVIGLKSATVRSKISGIRRCHIISGWVILLRCARAVESPSQRFGDGE